MGPLRIVFIRNLNKLVRDIGQIRRNIYVNIRIDKSTWQPNIQQYEWSKVQHTIFTVKVVDEFKCLVDLIRVICQSNNGCHR